MRLLKLLEYFYFVRTLDFSKNTMLLSPLVDKDRCVSSLGLFSIMTDTFVKVPVTAWLMQKKNVCMYLQIWRLRICFQYVMGNSITDLCCYQGKISPRAISQELSTLLSIGRCGLFCHAGSIGRRFYCWNDYFKPFYEVCIENSFLTQQ